MIYNLDVEKDKKYAEGVEAAVRHMAHYIYPEHFMSEQDIREKISDIMLEYYNAQSRN